MKSFKLHSTNIYSISQSRREIKIEANHAIHSVILTCKFYFLFLNRIFTYQLAINFYFHISIIKLFLIQIRFFFVFTKILTHF